MSTVDSLAPPQRPMRADARRNSERLLTAARAAFAEHGADACLDDIARRAGVGIGTLYRHFPTRRALLEAILREGTRALCAEAEELLGSPSPAEALVTWLRAVVVHATTYRGLAASLLIARLDDGSDLCSLCDTLRAAGAALLARAQRSGAVRPDVDAADLFTLVNAIAWATEQAPDGVDQADRLLSLTMAGLRCPEPTAK